MNGMDMIVLSCSRIVINCRKIFILQTVIN
jgi:hypothetical protein